MPSVTFSIPDKVKSEMEKFAWVNWSELAKQEVLKQDEKSKLFDELDELLKNSKLTDEDCLRFAKGIKKRFSKKE
jgi:hypothetical protein